MTAPTIDRATFDALKDTTGAEFAMELVTTFLEEAPSMMRDMRGALAAKDADKFRRAAHSLKSNANTFGALALGGMAKELELGSVATVARGDASALDPLADEYARVAAALAELRNA